LEKLRLNTLFNGFEYDKAVRAEFGVFAGLDEAGRGCLAGDVFAAAVILDEDVFIEGLNDSKKLSAKAREKIFGDIVSKAGAFAVARATIGEIEEMNILNAAMLAMKRAFEEADAQVAFALIDGNKCPNLSVKAKAVVGGDGKSASIAAASVLAKVSRDRYMEELDKIYPDYLFAKHKGYGTKEHYDALEKYGPCPVHRMSFLRKLYGRN